MEKEKQIRLKLTMREIELLRFAIETEADSDLACIEAWVDDKRGVLKEVYGKTRWKQIISDNKKDLKALYKIDVKFCDILKKQDTV